MSKYKLLQVPLIVHPYPLGGRFTDTDAAFMLRIRNKHVLDPRIHKCIS